MEVANMSKISIMILAVCAILATPVLGGHWKYKGTTVYIDGPSWDSDGESWYWWQWSDGDVWAWPGYLKTSGGAEGGAYVWLESDTNQQRSALAWSGVSAESDYEWEGAGSPTPITLEVSVTIDDANLAYYGHAVDRTGSVTASCASGADTNGGGGVTYVGYFYPDGYGYGEASSAGGTYALNDYSDCDPYKNYWDFDGWGGPTGWGWYEGSLGFECEAESEYPPTTPPDIRITVSSSLNGMAYGYGEIVRSGGGPNYWGGFDTQASYWIYGTSEAVLDGDIE
jgi:hypothetical protein